MKQFQKLLGLLVALAAASGTFAQQEVVLKISEGMPMITLALPEFVVRGGSSAAQAAAHSFAGIRNGRDRGLKWNPSSLSARPMMDRPVSRCDRKSMMYRPWYFVTPALWTVATGYGMSSLVRIGLPSYRVTKLFAICPPCDV